MDPGSSMVPAEFWGAKIAPKKTLSVGRALQPEDDTLDTFHLSQVALGPDAAPGRHVVWVEYEGVKSVIGSLTLGGIEQFQIDFPVNCEVNLSHSGKSDVYVTGYTTHQFMSIDSSDEEGEESSDDEDLALRGAGLANGMPARAAIAQRRLVQLGSSKGESEEDSEDGNSDEDSDLDNAMPPGTGIPQHQFSDMDDDSEEESGEEESSDEDGQPSAPDSGLGVAHGIRALLEAAASEDEDEDDSEWDTDEDDDDDDEEEDGEDEDEDEVPAAKVGAKRPPVTPVSTQQQKKAKAAATPGTPTGTGASSAQYQADLLKFLTANGATKLAVLGSQVKRVSGLPKMKKFLEDRPAVFKLDMQSGVVSLA